MEMILRITAGALLILAGVGSFFLGLLFLIAAAGDSGRYISGAILAVAGIVSLTSGIRLFRRGFDISPQMVTRRILQLAKVNNGECAEEVFLEKIGPLAADSLKLLVSRGTAREVSTGGRKIYIFPDFQMERAVQKCPFCGNDYSVRRDITHCPTCGGDLTMEKKRSARDDTLFSMDGEDS